MRIILIIIFLAISIINIFLFKDIFNWGVTNDLGWTFSSLLGWIFALVSAGICVFLILKSNHESKVLKLSTGIMVFLGVMIGTFAVNPIYYADYSKTSVAIKAPAMAIGETLNMGDKPFEGLVLIARANCPFCHQAINEFLVPLRNRDENLGIAVYLPSAEGSPLEAYQNELTKEIQFVNSNGDLPKDLTANITGFPTFAYIKNNEVIHVWNNNDFGYRALDWIENGLN